MTFIYKYLDTGCLTGHTLKFYTNLHDVKLWLVRETPYNIHVRTLAGQISFTVHSNNLMRRRVTLFSRVAIKITRKARGNANEEGRFIPPRPRCSSYVYIHGLPIYIYIYTVPF